jgi:hypothetical protein
MDIAYPRTWNRYTYAVNSPLYFTDPSGRCIQNPSERTLCTDMVITVEADRLEFTAMDTAADVVDLAAMDIASPMLNVLTGLLNDDPEQIALGYGQQALAAVPGGVLSGMTRTLGPAVASNIVVNLGGVGEVTGTNVVNVQAASIAGDTGVALRNAADIATSSGQRVVMAHGDALPFQSGSVRTVITNNVPIDRGLGYFGHSFTSSEIYRILASPLGRWLGSSAP